MTDRASRSAVRRMKVGHIRLREGDGAHDDGLVGGSDAQSHSVVVVDGCSGHGVLLFVHIESVHENSLGVKARRHENVRL